MNNWLSYSNWNSPLPYIYKNGLPSPDNLRIKFFGLNYGGSSIQIRLETEEMPNPLPDRWRINKAIKVEMDLSCYEANIKNAFFSPEQFANLECRLLIDFMEDIEHNQQNQLKYKEFVANQQAVIHLLAKEISISNVQPITTI